MRPWPSWWLAVSLAGSSMALAAKTERTLYTPARLATLRENLERFEWARRQRDDALKAVAGELDRSYAEIARYVPDPRIPRSAYVHETECPNCGLEMRRFGLYSWIITAEAPYKVTCPNCRRVFPSNDYQAYLESGLQDRRLLTGEHADDGWGWESPRYPGQKYWFVAYYNHWMAQRRLLPTLRHLATAYLCTDDPRYAYRAAALLWQLARYYPDYDYATQSRDGVERDPGYKGRLFYYTWECATVTACATAYDAIFPALLTPDPDLERLAGQSQAALRAEIEERLLRSMAREIVEETHVIGGNYGMHQVGLLQVAATLGDSPGQPDRHAMLDWLLNNRDYELYIYMPLHDALSNLVYRDGMPFESPGYNLSWVTNLTEIAELLRANGVDIFAQPRFRRLYGWPLDLVCAGRFTPALGDSGNFSNVGRMWRQEALRTAFEVYGDPAHAHALLSLGSGGARELTAKPLDEAAVTAAATLAQPPGYASRHLPGYGLAILQNGRPESPVAASLFYGRFIGHAHHDKMHLDLFAHGVSMLPDFGYPETANSNDPRRFGFFAHTVSHNTVMVDGQRQANARGRCLAYAAGPDYQYVEARNDGVYPQCSEYRRSVLWVETGPGQAFLVDVFRVRGGQQHDWLVHGGHATVTAVGPLPPPRANGTLAGPDVPYGQFYDDAVLGAAPYGSTSYVGYTGSGFQFLDQVRPWPWQAETWLRWDFIPADSPEGSPLSKPTPGAWLKAHLVGAPEERFVCAGRPQQNRKGSPASVPFLVRRRTGLDLESAFITAFEPGVGDGRLRAVTHLPTARPGLVALRLDGTAGEVWYVFLGTAGEAAPIHLAGVTFAGQVGVLALDPRGDVASAYLYNATRLAYGDWQLEGVAPFTTTLAACDYHGHTITLTDDLPPGLAPQGLTATLDAGGYGSAFEIRGVRGRRELDVGDQDPVCSRLLVGTAAAGKQALATTTTLYFPQPGMTLANAALQPLARLVRMEGGLLTLDREVPPEAWNAVADDGAPRAYVLEYGPGDRITIPTVTRYRRP